MEGCENWRTQGVVFGWAVPEEGRGEWEGPGEGQVSGRDQGGLCVDGWG